jgi:hypothetical protein
MTLASIGTATVRERNPPTTARVHVTTGVSIIASRGGRTKVAGGREALRAHPRSAPIDSGTPRMHEFFNSH